MLYRVLRYYTNLIHGKCKETSQRIISYNPELTTSSRNSAVTLFWTGSSNWSWLLSLAISLSLPRVWLCICTQILQDFAFFFPWVWVGSFPTRSCSTVFGPTTQQCKICSFFLSMHLTLSSSEGTTLPHRHKPNKMFTLKYGYLVHSNSWTSVIR